VTLIQEDPNIDNYIFFKDEIFLVDFDSITVSFFILQPIYIFIDNQLNNDIIFEKSLERFENIMKVFTKSNIFQKDLKTF
jgi:hypothetical protein